jgi:hypothetical protein
MRLWPFSVSSYLPFALSNKPCRPKCDRYDLAVPGEYSYFRIRSREVMVPWFLASRSVLCLLVFISAQGRCLQIPALGFNCSLLLDESKGSPEQEHAKTLPTFFHFDCGKRNEMNLHAELVGHKDGSLNRIPYYRCTRTMHFSNAVCTVKHINAD